MRNLIVVDRFCLRQFSPNLKNSKTQIKFPLEQFEKVVNEKLIAAGGLGALKDGYAEFCKHFIVENFTETKSNILEISAENAHLLKTGYKQRSEDEVPVLERWFDLKDFKDKLTTAKYLDCILYSRDQIEKENCEMGQEADKTDAPYGIVSIKPQDVDYELPMNPITQMRNALGKAEGGSGVPIDREAYQKSVDFWSNYALVL